MWKNALIKCLFEHPSIRKFTVTCTQNTKKQNNSVHLNFTEVDIHFYWKSIFLYHVYYTHSLLVSGELHFYVDFLYSTQNHIRKQHPHNCTAKDFIKSITPIRRKNEQAFHSCIRRKNRTRNKKVIDQVQGLSKCPS